MFSTFLPNLTSMGAHTAQACIWLDFLQTFIQLSESSCSCPGVWSWCFYRTTGPWNSGWEGNGQEFPSLMHTAAPIARTCDTSQFELLRPLRVGADWQALYEDWSLALWDQHWGLAVMLPCRVLGCVISHAQPHCASEPGTQIASLWEPMTFQPHKAPSLWHSGNSGRPMCMYIVL